MTSPTLVETIDRTQELAYIELHDPDTGELVAGGSGFSISEARRRALETLNAPGQPHRAPCSNDCGGTSTNPNDSRCPECQEYSQR